MVDIFDLYKQTLLGIAVGDSLGMPVEGWKPQQIVKYVENGRVTRLLDPQMPLDAKGERILKDEFGPVKQWNAPLKKGMWTDDTICSLDLAESLYESGMNLENLANRRLLSFDARNAMCGEFSGFGTTTRLAMENIRKGLHPMFTGVTGGPGTGPCMMMTPLGIYQHAKESKNTKQDAEKNKSDYISYARHVAQTTHLDSRSILCGILQQQMIYLALSNHPVDVVANSIDNLSRTVEQMLPEMADNIGALAPRINWVVSNYKSQTLAEAYKRFGAGSVVTQAYPFSLFAMLKYYDNPNLETLLDVISYGGDCDTTGSMVGALFGARGLDYESFIPQIDQSHRLVDNAQKFAKLHTKLV